MDTFFKSVTIVALAVGATVSGWGMAPAAATPNRSSEIELNRLSLKATRVSEFQGIVKNDDGKQPPEGAGDSDGGGRS